MRWAARVRPAAGTAGGAQSPCPGPGLLSSHRKPSGEEMPPPPLMPPRSPDRSESVTGKLHMPLDTVFSPSEWSMYSKCSWF